MVGDWLISIHHRWSFQVRVVLPAIAHPYISVPNIWDLYSSVREDLSRTLTFEMALREVLGPVFLLPRTGLAVTSTFG